MNGNLFDDIPAHADVEEVSDLLTAGNLRIERIVSFGQASPADFWYDQPGPEWVAVLTGAAGLAIEGEVAITVLRKGDHLLIPARRRHRVAWTDNPTIWLAVHFS